MTGKLKYKLANSVLGAIITHALVSWSNSVQTSQCYFDLISRVLLNAWQVNEAGSHIVAAESGDLLYWDMATRKVIHQVPPIPSLVKTLLILYGPPGEAREHPADLLLQEPVALRRRQQEGEQRERVRTLCVEVSAKSRTRIFYNLSVKVCARGNQTVGVRVSFRYIHQGGREIMKF